jgi:hypothetical protein
VGLEGERRGDGGGKDKDGDFCFGERQATTRCGYRAWGICRVGVVGAAGGAGNGREWQLWPGPPASDRHRLTLGLTCLLMAPWAFGNSHAGWMNFLHVFVGSPFEKHRTEGTLWVLNFGLK